MAPAPIVAPAADPAAPPMEVPPVEAPAPAVEAAPHQYRRIGRPRKWIPPTDGTPISEEMKKALRKREDNFRVYQDKERSEKILARNRASYHARKAAKAEMVATLERFKALAAAIPH